MRTDEELKEDVTDELKWDPVINETEIGVSVRDGIVTLSGSVDTYAEKSSAELAAKRVSGVCAVVENIEVKLKGSDKQSDEDIARIALNNLKWSTRVPQEGILVKVENAWVTLEGEVNWNFQREAAYNAVANIRGVRGVGNTIKVRTKIKPFLVKENIKKSFRRNAEVDAEAVDVLVEGHKITLSGNVQSWAEEKQAIQAAWSSPGVWEVENKLVIKPRTVRALAEPAR